MATQLAKLASRRDLRIAAMDLLARREHGAREMVRKLQKRFRSRGCSAEQVSEVVDHLVSDGLLSDERYAVSLCRHWINRGYGYNRVQEALRRSGIDESIDTILMRSFEEPIDWFENATRVYRKKYKSQAPRDAQEDGQKERAKRLRFLVNRGFDIRIACQVIEPERRHVPKGGE